MKPQQPALLNIRVAVLTLTLAGEDKVYKLLSNSKPLTPKERGFFVI